MLQTRGRCFGKYYGILMDVQKYIKSIDFSVKKFNNLHVGCQCPPDSQISVLPHPLEQIQYFDLIPLRGSAFMAFQKIFAVQNFI